MDDVQNGLFWNSSVTEIARGYLEDEEKVTCLVCGESFIKGRIYPSRDALYEAPLAAKHHIAENHVSMLDYLLKMNPAYTGLTEVQHQLVILMSEGLTDREISEKTGTAASTIRNHRFKLREREKQAKNFLAIMELLSRKVSTPLTMTNDGQLADAHRQATTVDDRYNITDRETEATLKAHMDDTGALKSYPVKEKKKIIILKEIAKHFTPGKFYTDKEVNRILKRIHEDNATLRRALVEYGFMERSDDNRQYWIKE